MKRLIILILGCATVLGGCGRSGSDAAAPQEKTRRAAAISHEAIEAALATAEDFFHTGDNVKAEATLVRLIERAPDEPRARELYAMVLMSRAAEAREAGAADAERALFGSAYKQYEVLVRLRPDSPGLRQSAGEVAQMAGLNDRAREQYTAAKRLSPDDPKPPFFLAQLLMGEGRYDEAEHELREVLRLDADEPMAHASLASLLAEQGRFDEALEHIADARAIDPRQLAFRLIEASIHRRKGDPPRAVELLVPLSESQRAREIVAAELSASFTAMGEHSRAAEAWGLVFRANPASSFAPVAASRAGLASVRAGERELAWVWLQRARQSTFGNAIIPEIDELERAIAESARESGR